MMGQGPCRILNEVVNFEAPGYRARPRPGARDDYVEWAFRIVFTSKGRSFG